MASIEMNHKPVEVARKPQEVCIKIEGASGEAPKMVGRHFDESDVLTSKVRGKNNFVVILSVVIITSASAVIDWGFDAESGQKFKKFAFTIFLLDAKFT